MTDTRTTDAPPAAILAAGRALAVDGEHSNLVAAIDRDDIRAAHLALVMEVYPGEYETPDVEDFALVRECDEGVYYISTHVGTTELMAWAREDLDLAGVPIYRVDLTTGAIRSIVMVPIIGTPAGRIVDHLDAYTLDLLES